MLVARDHRGLSASAKAGSVGSSSPARGPGQRKTSWTGSRVTGQLALEPSLFGLLALAAGVGILLMAAALLWLAPGQRAAQGFIWLCLAQGAFFVCWGAAFLVGGSDWPNSVWGRVGRHLGPAMGIGMLFFLSVFPQPRGPLHGVLSGPIIAVGAMLLALSANTFYAAWTSGNGWLAPLVNLRIFAAPLCAVVLFRDASRQRDETLARNLLLVSLGFAVLAAYEGLSTSVRILRAAPLLFGGGLTVLEASALVYAGGTVALLGVLGAQCWKARSRPMVRPYTWVMVIAATTSVVMYIVQDAAPGTLSYALGYGVWGMWALWLPILATYALLRYRIFDIDVRAKIALKGGFVLGAFLAVFLVASQLALNFLEANYGWLFGGVAAGLLLFGILPLQRWADRLAGRLLPNAKPLGEMTSTERVELYRQQLLFAWSDGRVGPEERRMLDFTRKRLGLDPALASRMEREIAGTGA